jgi:hypothetical protein
MKELLNASDAIELIQGATTQGYRCLGADGLEIVSDGVMGRLDLIIDASDPLMSRRIAADLTIDFIRANSASAIVWDVVIDAEIKRSG